MANEHARGVGLAQLNESGRGKSGTPEVPEAAVEWCEGERRDLLMALRSGSFG